MSTDIPFILDALLASSTVEVQVRFSHTLFALKFLLILSIHLNLKLQLNFNILDIS